MLKATKATVEWDKDKNHWRVRVQVGEEVIKRTLADVPENASDDVLRGKAVEDARDEGYEVDPASVVVVH
jgi:hypothetical protein